MNSPRTPATMPGEKPLAPFINEQLKYLLSHSPLPFKVDRIWAGSKGSRHSDHLTLSIPICLEYTKWDFLYNGAYPMVPPDIVFAAEDEGFNPLLDIENGDGKKTCLRDWNSKDPSRLMLLVREIRDLYLEFHKKRLRRLEDERLQFEADTMFSSKGIEVYVVNGADRAEEVKFAVPLLDSLDWNKLVPGCPWKRQPKIHLQVTFPVRKGYSSAPSTPRLRLVANPELRNLISTEDTKLPQWSAGMCMAAYLPTFEENLKVQLLEAVAAIGARRRFIEALAPQFGRPVEADSVFCRKATVFVASGVFSFVVHFSIPTQFPRMQPILTMQSCQHWNSHGVAVTAPVIHDYPWSPRWEASEMAERISDFLVDESLAFKKYCTDVTSQ